MSQSQAQLERTPRTIEDVAIFAAPGLFVIFWSSGFIGAKLGLPYAEPLTFLWLRMSGALLLLGIIILLTYVVAVCQFPHIIAGSTEAAFAVLSGHASVADYMGAFLVPTLIGNSVGGTVLAALLNHAPIVGQLTDPGPGDRD